jgi:hypothetical protein
MYTSGFQDCVNNNLVSLLPSPYMSKYFKESKCHKFFQKLRTEAVVALLWVMSYYCHDLSDYRRGFGLDDWIYSALQHTTHTYTQLQYRR